MTSKSETALPAFAVVGHPNKGKSSLVATLSRDDSVQISTMPGTTVKSRIYPMKVDGKVLYELIDTPGFQRAHKALSWLKQHETDIHKRSDIVVEFIDTFKGTDMFYDECELLTPIVNGAGILYVVDGSRPYGSEFEAEMEILRWTGQPNMALINIITHGDYVEQWRKALSQFFQIVRVFNAVTAKFDSHVELLRAFGQLKESWRAPLDNAVNFIIKDHQDKRTQSAQLIAELIAESLRFSLTKTLSEDTNTDDHKSRLKTQYFDELNKKEQRLRKIIEKLHHYHDIERNEKKLNVLDDHLFSQQTWSLFGLSQQELMMTGLAGGAAVGAVVDVAVGGASLLFGAGIGALVGGMGAILSYDKLANFKIMGMPLGGQALQIGPMQNRNFPYVILGRAIVHHQLIENRTHAMRNELIMTDSDGNTGASRIPKELRNQLETVFSKIRSDHNTTEQINSLGQLIVQCLR